jgi:hypothetical protein
MSDHKAQVRDRAKQISGGQDEDSVTVLSTGVRVRLKPVSSTLVEEIKSAIPMPDVPKVWLADKEREEENPNDPRYIEAVERAMMARADATLDALVLFGVELIDGIPDDDEWVLNLKMLERLGHLDLKRFNLKDDFDRKFCYKRYVAVAGADLRMVGQLHGLNPLEVARARSTFLGNQGGSRPERVSAEAQHPDGNRDEPGADGVGGGARGES